MRMEGFWNPIDWWGASCVIVTHFGSAEFTLSTGQGVAMIGCIDTGSRGFAVGGMGSDATSKMGLRGDFSFSLTRVGRTGIDSGGSCCCRPGDG
jgi:hypothetical protein